MNTSIVGRHIELTQAIKDYINGSMDILTKFNLDIISISAIVSKENKNKKTIFSFEFTINIANLDTIVVKQIDKDLYSGIDIAVDRASKILRRHHDKVSSHKATKLSELEANEIEDKVALELERMENNIMPIKLESYKPIDIQEALNAIKDNGNIFKVFYDKDYNLRVLYKMKEDNKFGLY